MFVIDNGSAIANGSVELNGGTHRAQSSGHDVLRHHDHGDDAKQPARDGSSGSRLTHTPHHASRDRSNSRHATRDRCHRGTNNGAYLRRRPRSFRLQPLPERGSWRSLGTAGLMQSRTQVCLVNNSTTAFLTA